MNNIDETLLYFKDLEQELGNGYLIQFYNATHTKICISRNKKKISTKDVENIFNILNKDGGNSWELDVKFYFTLRVTVKDLDAEMRKYYLTNLI